MTHSEQIGELAAALAQAQAEMKGAAKTSANPYFKSSYADIAAVWEAVRGPLTKHGLSVVQAPGIDNGLVTVTTLLLHSSGQWLRQTAHAEVKDLSAQSVGSAVTYLRRYALAAMAGTYGDVVDDDGEAAQGRQTVSKEPVMPADYTAWLASMRVAAEGGTDALSKAFAASSTECKRWAREKDLATWEGIKAEAAAQAPEPVVAPPAKGKPVRSKEELQQRLAEIAAVKSLGQRFAEIAADSNAGFADE